MAAKRTRKSPSSKGGSHYQRAKSIKTVMLRLSQDDHALLRRAAGIDGKPMAVVARDASIEKAKAIIAADMEKN